MLNYAQTCFVVMPFGTKKVGEASIDFDKIYDRIFVPAIGRVELPGGGKLEPKRTDKDFFAGEIAVEMFRYLEFSRFVVTDITGLNPNVMYELGVRHRARQSGTAIFRQNAVMLPFDITHIKAFPYEYEPDQQAEESRTLIARVITESVREDRTDNLVQMAIAHMDQRPRPQVEEMLRRAEDAIRHADAGTAIKLYRDALLADPGNVLTQVKLGILLKEQGGNFAEAAEVLDAATRTAPGYADAWRELGIAQGKLKQTAAGEASLRRAIELNPGDFDAMASLGGIVKRKGDLPAARDLYRESTRVTNGHSYPLLNALTLEAHLAGTLNLN